MKRTRGSRDAAADGPRPGRDHALPDFSHLPERVPPEDLVTTQDVDPGPDPRGGRDTETEFLLRNAGF